LDRATQTDCEVWVVPPKPAASFGSSDPNRLQALDHSTQTGCNIWVERPKLAASFGSSDPNRLQDLGRAAQTGYKIWVERPKPAANRLQVLGSNDPNRLQGLGGTTQTGCKVWVERPKPAASFGSSNMKVQMTFIYLNSYMVVKDPECPTYIISITHHNSFDGNYFGVICIVYSSNTICISL
jgi:hypothetical protein